MNIKKLKPLTNATRNTFVLNYKKVLSNDKPTKTLLKKLKNHAGRNNTGKLTVRHQGGGSKKFYRLIDFKRNKMQMYGTIKTIEYDPNRNCFISLVVYPDGEKRYVLQAKGMKVGDKIVSGINIDIKVGNAMPLELVPDGTLVHNVELHPGQGGKMVRAAGQSAQVLGLDDTKKYVILKMPSGETRKILKNCFATIGEVGNGEFRLIRYGKAGRKRWRGIRPTVRGAAMNPCDHPHGGGEGKASIGRPSPYTKWGKKAMGVKTRNKKKPSTKLIVRRRNEKRK